MCGRAELRFDEPVDDPERDDAEDDRNPRDEAGRGEFEQRLLESPLSLVDGVVEYPGGIRTRGHGLVTVR
ncbi:hypothetical protein JCM9743_35380 [Natrinema sp. JCM 9743]